MRVEAGQRVAQRERVELVAHRRELERRGRDLAAALVELRDEHALVVTQLRVRVAELAEQAVVVALEAERVDELVDDLHEVGQLPRLGDDVVEVAGVDRRDQVLGLGVAGDDRAPAVRAQLGDAREQVRPGEARHAQVGEHDRDVRVVVDELDRLEAVVREQDAAPRPQHPPEVLQIRGVVVDAHDERLAGLVGARLGTVGNSQCEAIIGRSRLEFEPRSDLAHSSPVVCANGLHPGDAKTGDSLDEKHESEREDRCREDRECEAPITLCAEEPRRTVQDR